MRKYVVRGVSIVSENADYQLHIEFFIQGKEKDLLQVIDNINENKYGKGALDFNAYTKQLIEFLTVTSDIEIRKSRSSDPMPKISDEQLVLIFVIAFDETQKSVRDVYNNIYGKWEYEQLIERAEFIDFLTKFIEAVDSSDPEV